MKLEQAVREAVAKKVGDEFSIYDITLDLRKQLNAADLKIDGLNYEYLDNGLYGFNLPHAEVRQTFRDLADELGVVIVNQGRFVTYKLDAATSNTKKSSDPAVAANKISVGGSPVTGSTAVSTILTGVAQFEDEITAYLKNKGGATMAQIQSRLKTKGITCGEIKKFLEGLDGVKIEVEAHVSKTVAKPE